LESPSSSNVDPGSSERDAHFGGKLSRKVELSCRLAAEPVIDTMRGEAEAEPVEACHRREKRHRVRPATHGNDDTRVARKRALTFERATNDGDERRAHYRVLSKTTTVSTWLV
jgi:hypothetical protein